MLENYYEQSDFDKEIENYPKEKLIYIVENGYDIELIEAAFLKLSFIDEDYALTKGMEFLRNDVNISRQNMAGWMISLAEYYLEPIHEKMKEYILDSGYIHCDETPFTMPEHNKEYMWVFHSPGGKDNYPV